MSTISPPTDFNAALLDNTCVTVKVIYNNSSKVPCDKFEFIQFDSSANDEFSARTSQVCQFLMKYSHKKVRFIGDREVCGSQSSWQLSASIYL